MENPDGLTEIDRKLSSPFSRIHDDILWMIFEINSNMDEDQPQDGVQESLTLDTSQALDTTRHSSQVCSLWRTLIVNSSILWANLIDIPMLDRAGNNWREEVIKRSKNSTLHVKGNVYIGSPEDTGPWLSGFLDHNWPRIRIFDVLMLPNHGESQILSSTVTTYRRVLSCLSNPAPALESFTVYLPHHFDPLKSGATLFNGHTPCLRSFKTTRMIFSVKQHPTWLPQLHHLQILKCHTPTFSSADTLYQVLAKMPHLESLALKDAIASPYMGIQHYPIRFPQLQKIQIHEDGYKNYLRSGRSGKGLACWPLLNSIIPKPGCSVDVTLKSMDMGGTDIAVLCRLIKNYFDVHQPTSLDLGTGLKSFWIKAFDFRDSEDPPTDGVLPFFCLRIDNIGAVSPSDSTMYQLFQGISFLTLPRVTDLSLVVSTSHSAAFLQPKFAGLLRSFSSVEMLTATPPVLGAICSCPLAKSTSPLFPQLKVLEVPDFRTPSEYQTSASFTAILSAFLKLQKASGAPLSTFIYNAEFEGSSFTLENLSFLDKLGGLKVVWNTRQIGSGEYICGSGKPEELNLAQKLSDLGGEIPHVIYGAF